MTVHLLKVAREHDQWDEMNDRRRRWVPASEAAGEATFANVGLILKKAAASV